MSLSKSVCTRENVTDFFFLRALIFVPVTASPARRSDGNRADMAKKKKGGKRGDEDEWYVGSSLFLGHVFD